MKTVVSLSEIILSMERQELPRVSPDSVRAIRAALVRCCEIPVNRLSLTERRMEEMKPKDWNPNDYLFFFKHTNVKMNYFFKLIPCCSLDFLNNCKNINNICNILQAFGWIISLKTENMIKNIMISLGSKWLNRCHYLDLLYRCFFIANMIPATVFKNTCTKFMNQYFWQTVVFIQVYSQRLGLHQIKQSTK